MKLHKLLAAAALCAHPGLAQPDIEQDHPGHLDRRDGHAPYHRPVGSLVEDSYIVMLHENETLNDHFERMGVTQDWFNQFHYMPSFNAYTCSIDEKTMHDTIRRDSAVKIVQHNAWHDREVLNAPTLETSIMEDWNTARIVPRSISRLFRRWAHQILNPALFHMQMMTSRIKITQPRQGNSFPQVQSRLLPDGGAGVHIYVMDDGVNLDHKSFGGRAVNFQNNERTLYAPPNSRNPRFATPPSNAPNRNDYHGTMVAGFAGGAGFGAAIGAQLVSMRIYNDWGIAQTAFIIKGLDAIIAEHDDYYKQAVAGTLPTWRGSIINFSSSLPSTPAFQAAIVAVNAKGILFITAAGNEDTLITSASAPCYYRSGVVDFLCVGATDDKYVRGKWTNSDGTKAGSNYGVQVEVAAAGVDVWSANRNNTNGMIKGSGTSYAAPQVAGVAAVMMSWEFYAGNVNAVKKALRDNGLVGLPTDFGGPETDGDRMYFLNSGIDFNNDIPFKGAGNQPKTVKDAKLVDWAPSQVDRPPVNDPGKDYPVSYADTGSNPLKDGDFGSIEPSDPLIPGPYAQHTCNIEVTLNAYWNERDRSDPFWLTINNMTDHIGNTLKPNPTEWQRHGAAAPYEASSLLEDKLKMLPISKNAGDFDTEPYVQFYLGAQQWATTSPWPTDDNGAGCRRSSDKSWTANKDPHESKWYCQFVCRYGGGKSSNGDQNPNPPPPKQCGVLDLC